MGVNRSLNLEGHGQDPSLPILGITVRFRRLWWPTATDGRQERGPEPALGGVRAMMLALVLPVPRREGSRASALACHAGANRLLTRGCDNMSFSRPI